MGEKVIKWRVHMKKHPNEVYFYLSTDEGRSQFWAERAEEVGGRIHFQFPNGTRWAGEVLERMPPYVFAVRYFGGSEARFELTENPPNETDLTLTDTGVADSWLEEVKAGWVSVLLTLKAAVEHGVDLRNHNSVRTWEQGYCDN